MKEDRNLKYLNIALLLGLITIVYNIAEGIVSIYFGLEDDTLALLGFGIDSFVEVLSGIGITHMIIRMKRNRVEKRDRFERQALRITGISFYILSGGLILGSVLNLIYDSIPETTIPGVIISVISLSTMYFLYYFKLKTARKLGSDALEADAKCTRACFNLSIILLLSSLFYEIFSIGYFDILGSLGISYFSFKEGRESFEKAGSDTISCCGDNCVSTIEGE
jgi:divalent metal cation (Fe/Co/Zn/Cd) transporter